MPSPPLAAFALSASVAAVSTPAPAGQVTGIELAQVTIRGRIVIRVPSTLRDRVAPAPQLTPARPNKWAEKKGPKCIAADQFALVEPYLNLSSAQRVAYLARSVRVLRRVAQKDGVWRSGAHCGLRIADCGFPELQTPNPKLKTARGTRESCDA